MPVLAHHLCPNLACWAINLYLGITRNLYYELCSDAAIINEEIQNNTYFDKADIYLH